ncbi:MAG: permease-like cell division protein FtsX [Ruminococcus sp.]|nr:permease-like cell division protein FtsX [Ruminococcus sp.]
MQLSGLSYLIKEGFRNVWANRIMSIASICVLISCFVLTGSAVLFSMNVSRLVDKVGNSNETTVYVKNDLSKIEAAYVGREIKKLNNVTEVIYYPKDEALKEYKDKLGDEVFKNLKDDNPLPDAFKITMDDLSKYNLTVEKIMKINGVDTVSNRSDIARKLTELNNLVQTLSTVIIIALAVISLFIISNTIKATMHNRRFEISIMKSVGATDAFVRIPFVVEGMALGFAGAIISTIALLFLYDGIMRIASGLFPFIAITSIPITSVILGVLAIFCAAGIIIGALSGFISIRKYLKKESKEILGW